MAEYQLEETDFMTVKEYWSRYLWPERKSAIEEVSWVDRNGEINSEMQKAKSYFWCIKDITTNNILGVISGTDAGALGFRSRGIWVHESYRHLGLGKQLIEAVIKKASLLGHKSIWTMPRNTALRFYEKVGFKEKKMIEGFEFGPHHIAEYEIKD